ncbi:MAG: hypothetical protein J6C53_03050 [Clostridia bacterium]|nr:hypothetical protein [Clostridia bacterium]
MEKVEFYKIVDKLILPLFTGACIEGEEESSNRDNEVAFGKKNSLLIKPSKADEYRLVLKRGQPFQAFEVNLLKSILAEINDISNLQLADDSYISVLQENAIEKAICQSICEPDTVSSMFGIINELQKWAVRTYEGKKTAIGIIINLSTDISDQEDALNFYDIMNKDFFALLSDGVDSYVEFDKKGNLLGYVQVNKVKKMPSIAPLEFEDISRYCNEKRIGIVLTKNGDFLIFKNRNLLFSKRAGNWNVYSHEEVIQLLSYRGNYSLKDIRRSVYYTALDTSFAYDGGCIVYLNKDMAESALMHINANDIIDERYFEIKKAQELEFAGRLYNLQNLSAVEAKFNVPYMTFLREQKCVKSQSIRKLINGKPFHELSRKLRQELVSMDGATVIDSDGTIIAVGAILKIEAGSEGGGRLAAATTLSKYGVAIKISQDGIMKAFYPDRKNGKVKTLFTVG